MPIADRFQIERLQHHEIVDAVSRAYYSLDQIALTQEVLNAGYLLCSGIETYEAVHGRSGLTDLAVSLRSKLDVLSTRANAAGSTLFMGMKGYVNG